MNNTENLEKKRWWIAIAAVIIQLCLGTVYAWSVFKIPLMKKHGWGTGGSDFEIQVTFMILMLVIGCAAAFGGTLVDKKGPRFVATIGGILFGIGTLIAGLADQFGNIWLLYFGFGFIAALGNGFGYVTPIATLIRWFPDKRGLVTGLAVMGFGGGAFFMGKIAPIMINAFQKVGADGTTIEASGVSTTFYIWGVIFLILVVGAAQLFKNPPQGWLPAGFTPSKTTVSAAQSFKFGEAVKTRQWWMLWGILCLNVSAGLGLISQLSPIAQDLYKPLLKPDLEQAAALAALAGAGGAVVAYSAIFNGLGRLFWAKISDNIGRKAVFSIMLSTQAALYLLVALGFVSNYWLFLVVACYLLACYGGGFATMPAFAADSFGPAYIGKVYGFMLTAWSTAGLLGPLVFSTLKEQSLFIASGLLILGLLITLAYKRPAPKGA